MQLLMGRMGIKGTCVLVLVQSPVAGGTVAVSLDEKMWGRRSHKRATSSHSSQLLRGAAYIFSRSLSAPTRGAISMHLHIHPL